MAIAATVALSATHHHLNSLLMTEIFLPWSPDHKRRSLQCCPTLGITGYLANGSFTRLCWEYRRRCNAPPFSPCNVNTPSRIKINNLCESHFLRCHCFDSVSSYDGATTPEFVTLFDQTLLMASIFFTYVAGVVPDGKTGFTMRKSSSCYEVNEICTLTGRCPLEITKRKLLDALEVIDRADILGGGVLELENSRTKQPLPFHAIAVGPRLRLLWAALTHVGKEVHNSPGLFLTAMGDWMVLFSEIIRGSTLPVCTAWLRKELAQGNCDMNEELVSTILEKFEGSSTFTDKIKKSGKCDLCTELLCFLKFDSVREGCYYNTNLFLSKGTAILEDLVIALANSIASVYLDLISLEGNTSNELNDLGPTLCSLSTRALQRLCNENIEAVVSMYEDQFDLSILRIQLLEEPNGSGTEQFALWRKISSRNSNATSQLKRYCFSLFLEMSDIVMPLVRTFISKVSDAIAFFLVCLIGRSLGLFYTRIRQSLRWK